MKIIGFNFQKISAEKFKELSEGFKMNTKIDISSIESINSDFLKTKEDLIKISFVYSISYDSDFAKIDLAGSFILSVEPKIAKEILKGWKDKKTSEEFRLFIFNMILRKSNVKALQLEDELLLPYHIPLPSLSKSKDSSEKEK